ncbi:MAG: hypothetical protein K2Y37_06710, partial [Pirellulales bacterium]|nr:hypothetical protein [Pirellulales bacterium]
TTDYQGTCQITDNDRSVTVDIDTDSNNDGQITEADDGIEDIAPGSFVLANDDDDDQNGVTDDSQPGPLTAENDLAEIRLSLDSQNYTPAQLAALRVSLEAVSGGNRIRLWSVSDKSGEVALGTQWAANAFPNWLFVEGLETGDVVLDWVVRDSGEVLSRDTVALTVVRIDLDIINQADAEIDESQEVTPGGFVEVNLDDDDNDDVPDNEDDQVDRDNDLLPLLLHAIAPAGAGGFFTLDFVEDKLRIWKNSDRTERVIPLETQFDAGQDRRVYVEGFRRPEGPSNERIALRWNPTATKQLGQDEVVVHVIKLEFLTRNDATGEVYQPDEIAAGDARPEVTATVVDRAITSEGKLRVTIAGTVYDRLSELTNTPSNRLQRLDFFVNDQLARSIDNLPALATGAALMPWTPYPFTVAFQETFEFDNPAGPYLIRVQTSPNGARVAGWDLIGLATEYQDVTGDYGSLDPVALYNAATPTINPATGEEIVSRRYLSGPFFPAGSYVTRPQPDPGARIFAPVDVHAMELDGSQPGSLEPLLLRVDGLDIESAPHVTLELEGVAQQIRPFTYSPQKFYVADTSTPSERPRIFVVTPRNLSAAELEALRPGDIDIGRSGGELDARLRVPNGQRFIDAKVTVFKHTLRDPGDGPNNDGFTTMEELLSWYQVIYDGLGVRLLQYYQQGGNLIELADVWGDHKTSGSSDGDLTIYIEEDIPPFQAAQYLWQELQGSRGYFWSRVPATDSELRSEEARAIAGRKACEIGAAAANLYLSGLTILSDGADFVMTVHEVQEGNYQAAVGFLPFVPASIFSSGGRVIIRAIDGRVVGEFTDAMIEGMVQAAKKRYFSERWAELENLGISLRSRQLLVESRFIPVPYDRRELRARMIAAGDTPPTNLRNPQAHHDMIWDERFWFAMHGFDVNDPQFGRWVEGTPPGDHQRWSKRFSDAWTAFVGAEKLNDPDNWYTADAIRSKYVQLKASFP